MSQWIRMLFDKDTYQFVHKLTRERFLIKIKDYDIVTIYMIEHDINAVKKGLLELLSKEK